MPPDYSVHCVVSRSWQPAYIVSPDNANSQLCCFYLICLLLAVVIQIHRIMPLICCAVSIWYCLLWYFYLIMTPISCAVSIWYCLLWYFYLIMTPISCAVFIWLHLLIAKLFRRDNGFYELCHLWLKMPTIICVLSIDNTCSQLFVSGSSCVVSIWTIRCVFAFCWLFLYRTIHYMECWKLKCFHSCFHLKNSKITLEAKPPGQRMKR